MEGNNSLYVKLDLRSGGTQIDLVGSPGQIDKNWALPLSTELLLLHGPFLYLFIYLFIYYVIYLFIYLFHNYCFYLFNLFKYIIYYYSIYYYLLFIYLLLFYFCFFNFILYFNLFIIKTKKNIIIK